MNWNTGMNEPKSPWSMTKEGEEILPQDIRAYFLKHEKMVEPLQIQFSEEDFIGHRDGDGIIVLPEDWQDARMSGFQGQAAL